MTPATQKAQALKATAADGMQKQLAGPLETMKNLEDKFSMVKQLHNETSPVINGVKDLLDTQGMLDTTTGTYPGTAAAMAAIGVVTGITSALKKLDDEYAKIKLKMLMPEEFAKSKLTGDLDFVNEDFSEAGFFEDVEDGIYDIIPDTDIIDEVNDDLEEAGGKYDYTIQGL